jgi:hypothetical protein
MFPDSKKLRYTLTQDDITAINEMMDVAHAFQLKVNTERDDSTKKTIFVFAVARDQTWYTGQGDGVCEAVDAWFDAVTLRSGTTLRRWDVSAERINKLKV